MSQSKLRKSLRKYSRYYVLLKLLLIIRKDTWNKNKKGKENRITHWFSSFSSFFFDFECHACGVISAMKNLWVRILTLLQKKIKKSLSIKRLLYLYMKYIKSKNLMSILCNYYWIHIIWVWKSLLQFLTFSRREHKNFSNFTFNIECKKRGFLATLRKYKMIYTFSIDVSHTE